jgi:hypothetical protein
MMGFSMPDFEGTGPLKQGRIVGLDLGPHKKCSNGCQRKTNANGLPEKDENPSE